MWGFASCLGKNASEAIQMLKIAYKDEAMGQAQVYTWFARFKNGDMSIDHQDASEGFSFLAATVVMWPQATNPGV